MTAVSVSVTSGKVTEISGITNSSKVIVPEMGDLLLIITLSNLSSRGRNGPTVFIKSFEVIKVETPALFKMYLSSSPFRKLFRGTTIPPILKMAK
ncbi:hypothetical protein ES703_120050 [subsurface metagenome]